MVEHTSQVKVNPTDPTQLSDQMHHPVQYCSSQYDPLPPQEGYGQPEPGDVSVVEVFGQNPDREVALQDESDNCHDGYEYLEAEMHFFFRP